MKLSIILGYQFGNAAAIREMTESKAALWTGMALVLITGVARNYDQTHFLETPRWLIGPLLFSIVSGSFLFWVLYSSFIRRRLDSVKSAPSATEQYRSFMGLFWMTAPIAWLYAIPVERFLTSYQAAQANLTLLAVVSAWRVALMARVVSVLQNVPYLRALNWVLVPASLEVIGVVFLGGLFGGSFAERVMADMSGMRNAPEENLLLNALGAAFNGSWIVLGFAAIALAIFRFRGDCQPFPRVKNGRIPWLTLLFFAAGWSVIAIKPQAELARTVHYERLVRGGQYSVAVAYLSEHSPDDFAPARRLAPSPYEYEVYEHLPGLMAALDGTEPAWVRQLYFDYFEALLGHRYFHQDATTFLPMVQAVERLPEGEAWLERNRTRLTKLRRVIDTGSSNAEVKVAAEELASALERLRVPDKE